MFLKNTFVKMFINTIYTRVKHGLTLVFVYILQYLHCYDHSQQGGLRILGKKIGFNCEK